MTYLPINPRPPTRCITPQPTRGLTTYKSKTHTQPLPTTYYLPTTYLSTYQPINLSTYQPINLSTYQPTNLPTNQPTNQPTYQPTNLPTNQPINLPGDVTLSVDLQQRLTPDDLPGGSQHYLPTYQIQSQPPITYPVNHPRTYPGAHRSLLTYPPTTYPGTQDLPIQSTPSSPFHLPGDSHTTKPITLSLTRGLSTTYLSPPPTYPGTQPYLPNPQVNPQPLTRGLRTHLPTNPPSSQHLPPSTYPGTHA